MSATTSVFAHDIRSVESDTKYNVVRIDFGTLQGHALGPATYTIRLFTRLNDEAPLDKLIELRDAIDDQIEAHRTKEHATVA